MEEQKNFISKLYKVVTYIIIGILLIVINMGNVFKNVPFENVKTILFMCIGLIVLFLINKFIILKIKNEKIYKISIIIGLVIFFLLEIFSYKYYKVKYNWDFGIVMKSAEQKVTMGNYDEIGYFLAYPHNIGCFTIEIIAMFLFGKKVIGAYIINMISIFLSALFGTLCSKKINGYKGALNTIILLLVSAPLYLYTPIVYTDTLSVMFPVLTMYIYILYKENKDSKKKQWIYWIIMTIVSAIAFNIKPVSAIVYVAIIIDNIFNNKKVLKKILISLILFIVTMQSFTCIAKKSFVNSDLKMDLKVPPYHYVMIGLSKPKEFGGPSFGWGTYNEEDLAYTCSKTSYSEKVNADKIIIKERLKDFGVKGYINFLWHKFSYVWNDPTYFCFTAICWDTINTTSTPYKLISSDYYKDKITVPLITYCGDIIMLLILIGYIFDMKNEKKDVVRILEISMVGIAMFLLIWEARSRYIYFMIPVFIVLATNSVNCIMEKINVYKIKRLEENKNK